MLKGSIFVDFMGSYQALPEALRMKGEGFFAEPALAEGADFAAIGFRAARIADTASVAGDSRRNIPEALKRLSDLDAGLYGPGPVFDDNHHTRWPTFLFTIGTDKLDVMPLTVTD